MVESESYLNHMIQNLLKMKSIALHTMTIGLLLISMGSQAQFRAGAGLGFGTGPDDLAINLNGEYLFDDQWSAEAHLSFFFVENPPVGDAGFWMIDFDAHYHFSDVEGGGLYALGGLNIATSTAEVNLFGVERSSSDTSVGLNLGAGYVLDLDRQFIPFGDVRYIISEVDQVFIRVGAKYSF